MNASPETESAGGPSEPGLVAARFPWPPGEQDPVVDSLADTWRGVVLRPARFFAAMPPDLRFGGALLYYLVVGILGAAIQLFWATLLPQPGGGMLSELLGTTGGTTPLVDFLLSPLYLLLSLFLAAGATHLLVLAFIPDNRGLGTTLRVFCFAYSPVLFGVIPYVGAVAAFIWMTVLAIVGLRETQHTSTGRAAAAVLVPLAIAVVFIALGYAVLQSGALLLER